MRIKSRAPSSRTIRDQLQNVAFCEENFVLACLTYRMSSVFGTGRPGHEFYGLKASQMKKVPASSHEYPHVEEIKLES